LAVAVVVEEREHAFGGGAMGVEFQAQAGRGAAADFLGLQLFGQFPGGAAAEAGDEAEEVGPIGAGDEEGLAVGGLADPGVGGAGFELGEGVIEENDAEIEECRLLDGDDVFAVHEVDRRFDPLFVFDFGAEAEAPLVVAPGDGAPVFFGEGGAGEETVGLGEFAGEFGEAGAGEVERRLEEIV
jgi:hypothetical protein